MKKIKTFEEFSSHCNKGHCLRKTMKTHKCLTEGKQKNCFNRYGRKLVQDKDRKEEKKEENQLWVELVKEVKLRDKTCRIWNILTKDEQIYVLKNFPAEFSLLSKTLDTCHIVSRAQSGELSMDSDNLLLICRYFHRLLTDLKDCVTRKPITKEQEMEWYMRAKNGR